MHPRQFLVISLSSPPNSDLFFKNTEIFPLHSINILGVQIASNLSWKERIIQISKLASKKLYVGLIRPCLEHCFHIWGASLFTYLLDRLESKAIHLINDPVLNSLSAARWPVFFSFIANALATLLRSWRVACPLLCGDHVRPVKRPRPTGTLLRFATRG